MKDYSKKIAAFAESWILILVLLLIWGLYGASGKINTLIMPSLGTVLQTFLSGIADGSLLLSLGISIKRVLTGYVISGLAGIALGIVIGLSRHMQRITNLVIQILRPIPPIAWIPLVILWMGIGETSKVFLIFLGGFFPVLINVTDGIRYTDKKLTEVAAVMETPRKKYITQLVIPAAMPSIFTGLRVSLGSCWTCVVAAELVASTSGIGYMISNARNFGQMDVVIVGMLAIGIVGKIMDVILNKIGNRILAWNE